MGAIIAQLLAMFGPLLSDFLAKWLESLLNKTAKANPGITTKQGMLNAAIDATPRVRVGRRALLRTMRDHADNLDAAAKKEIRVLASVTE